MRPSLSRLGHGYALATEVLCDGCRFRRLGDSRGSLGPVCAAAQVPVLDMPRRGWRPAGSGVPGRQDGTALVLARDQRPLPHARNAWGLDAARQLGRANGGTRGVGAGLARSEDDPMGDWHSLKKGLRGTCQLRRVRSTSVEDGALRPSADPAVRLAPTDSALVPRSPIRRSGRSLPKTKIYDTVVVTYSSAVGSSPRTWR